MNDDTASKSNNTTAAAAAAASSAKLPTMGRGKKADEGRATAIVWMNRYLGSGSDLSNHQFTNTSYCSINIKGCCYYFI